MKRVILAYSGGLDTSVILHYLVSKGYEVICFLADIGQEEDFFAIKEKALSIGAAKVYIEDVKEEFLTQFVFKAMQANVKYEGKYLLGTAIARPVIGKALAMLAKREGTNLIAHGATGKGNDQIRFELALYKELPEVEIIAPWRMAEFYQRFEGRKDLIHYAKENNIPISCSLAHSYSTDENLMHMSYEGGILENLSITPPEEMFTLTVAKEKAPDKSTRISITFERGIPTALEVNGQTITDALSIFQTLQKIAGANGIGRIDIVESRIVGMKSRGVYESPAATVLWFAHADLEHLVLPREVLQLKEQFQSKISELIYQGLWFTPEMDFLLAAIEQSQQSVTGTISLELYKGNISVLARFSEKGLYDQSLASMDEAGNYNQSDATGFIHILSLRWKKNHFAASQLDPNVT